MIHQLRRGNKGVRDRTFIILAFCSAMRLSELPALHIEDLTIRPEGMKIFVGEPKGGRSSGGRTVTVSRENHEFRPATNVESLIRRLQSDKGSLFRTIPKKNGDTFSDTRLSYGGVVLLFKETKDKAGIKKNISPHSTGSGHITQALKPGKSTDPVHKNTGHRPLHSLPIYLREVDGFQNNSSRGLLAP